MLTEVNQPGDLMDDVQIDMPPKALRLLLVEDDPADALLFWKRSSKAGFSLRKHQAPDMGTALKMLSEEAPYDAIVTDLSLPDAQGLQCVRALLLAAPETPLLVLTGNSDQKMALEGVQTGAQDYLVKGNGDAEDFKRALLYAIERKQHQVRLRHQAEHDALTGLLNRAAFEQALNTTLTCAREQQRQLGLLYLDLNDFKPVNDTWGHAVGDELLQQVSQRLKETLREGDIVARLGGDEFAVLIPHLVEPGLLEEIASRLEAVLQRPFTLSVAVAQISASVGFAVYPDHGEDAAALLERADQQMYQSKRARASIGARILRRQPLINLRTGEVAGEYATVARSGRWSIDRLQQTIDAWLRRTGPIRRVLSLPAEALRFLKSAHTICGARAQVATRYDLTLIIDELISGDPIVIAAIQHLMSCDITVGVGRGCGVEMLVQLPLKTFNLPAAHTDAFSHSPDTALIVSALLKIAHGRKMDIIAPCVAHPVIRQHLIAAGCTYGVGDVWRDAVTPPEERITA